MNQSTFSLMSSNWNVVYKLPNIPLGGEGAEGGHESGGWLGGWAAGAGPGKAYTNCLSGDS